MNERTERSDVIAAFADRGNIRLTDIGAYLDAYEDATSTNKEKTWPTYESLLGHRGNHAAVLGQIERVVKQFFDPQKLASLGRRSEVTLLFEKTEDGLKPTPEARALYKWLAMVTHLYTHAKTEVQRASEEKPPKIVSVGTVQTFGLHVLSRIFSNLAKDFTHRITLNVELDNSEGLLPRLQGGLLDFVIGYGEVSKSGYPLGKDSVIRFQPLGLDTVTKANPEPHLHANNPRLILATHKNHPVYLRNGTVVEGKAKPIDRTRERPHDGLSEIDLTQIDLLRTRLIVARSIFQPAPLRELIATYAAQIQFVRFYDEGLALCRMSQGAAILTEIFLARHGIEAYRLTPPAGNPLTYARALGVYYRNGRELSEEAYQLIKFVDVFLRECKEEIWKGTIPSFGGDEKKPGSKAGKDPLAEKYSRFVEKFRNTDDPAHLHDLKPEGARPEKRVR